MGGATKDKTVVADQKEEKKTEEKKTETKVQMETNEELIKARTERDIYVHQGTKIVLTGRIQTGSYTNKDNIKVYTTEVIAEDIEFAESKAAAEGSGGAGGHQKPEQTENDGFMNIPEGIDEELPFN